jgi:hypothetical protein
MAFRCFPIIFGLLVAMLSASAHAQFVALPLDPRFTMDPRINRNLVEHPLFDRYRWPPGAGRPLRCSIRRTVEIDYLPEDWNRMIIEPDLNIVEPAAPLREYEFGFERVGDPATSERIEAFMRFRFERLSDGKPLRVERPLVDFDGGNGMTSDWLATPVDSEGLSGARIDIDDMDEAELQRFIGTITRTFRVAVTLPELKQDRVYWIGKRPHGPNKEVLAECMCAFGNDDISWILRSQCAQK